MAKYEFNGKNSNSFELKKEKTARWIYFFLKQTFTHKIMVLFPHSQLNQFTPLAFHHYMHVLHWAWQLSWKVWSAVNSVNFPEKCELILWQRTKQPQFIFYERKLYLSLWMCLINCGTQSNFRVFFSQNWKCTTIKMWEIMMTYASEKGEKFVMHVFFNSSTFDLHPVNW